MTGIENRVLLNHRPFYYAGSQHHRHHERFIGGLIIMFTEREGQYSCVHYRYVNGQFMHICANIMHPAPVAQR